MKNSEYSLNKTMTLPQLVFYGTGTILGAGIFVVIGEIIGEAGRLAPIAYLLAASVAITTALSFAELGARIPSAGGPIDYLETAFGISLLGTIAGWMLMIANTVSAATIVTGFVNYLSIFVEIEGWIISAVLITVLGTLAVAGIKQSAWFMTVTTSVGILTLIAVLVATRDGIVAAPGIVLENISGGGNLNYSGLFSGAFLAVYSFIGFGDMAQTAEEVKDVEKNLPRAILFSLGIVFVFYLLVSAALIGTTNIEKLAQAEAPLVEAVVQNGWPGWPVGVASLFVIVNGSLTQTIAASRLLMDIARDGRGAPRILARVNQQTKTPALATVLLAGIVLMLTIFIPLKSLAELTSLAILFVFTGVNAALIKLKKGKQPGHVPDVPILIPVLGATICSVVIGMQVYQLTAG